VPIRAVAVDIDGTMTDYRRLLDWDGVQAVRTAERKGIPVMAATGNVAPVTKAFLNFVGASGPAVCENGGVVYDGTFARRKILGSRRHPDRAVRHLRRKGLDAKYIASDPWRVSEVALELTLDEEEVRAALTGWRLGIVSTKFALHLMEPGLDKANGLRAALEFLRPQKLAMKDVLAVGDSNNDLGMFAACGANAAPANATAQVKAAAHYISKKKHGAGVKDALEHYGVI
jgi:phosphoglycolate phosphatase (TIGR01487 family)